MIGFSSLYAGDVVHVRKRPRRHKLHYKVFSLLLDLDELPELSRTSRLFGHNRAAVFSFWDTDHGSGKTGDLRPWVEAQLAAAGIDTPHPRIRVLCYPRIFGYVFNPLTVYFCYGRDGGLTAILYEVCNTFGERRTYVIPAGPGSGPVRQTCAKELYVSPFVPMDCTYQFTIAPPAEAISVCIDESDADGFFLRAIFSGKRQELTDATLLRALLRYPLMTLKVTFAIHWEALKLWLKGVKPLRHHAAAERIATTVVAKSVEPETEET